MIWKLKDKWLIASHAVIKTVFGAGKALVTTVKRVHVKMMVTAFAFNLYQLCTLKNARII
jgi:IS5 family transposase